MHRCVVAWESRSIKRQNYQAQHYSSGLFHATLVRAPKRRACMRARSRAREAGGCASLCVCGLCGRCRERRPVQNGGARDANTDFIFGFFLNNNSSMHTHALHEVHDTRPHTHLSRHAGPRAPARPAHTTAQRTPAPPISIFCVRMRVRRHEAPLRTCGGGALLQGSQPAACNKMDARSLSALLRLRVHSARCRSSWSALAFVVRVWVGVRVRVRVGVRVRVRVLTL